MDFNPFAYDWEDDAIPAQTPPSQSSEVSAKASIPEKVPGTPKKVPTSPKKVSASPKRKRNDVDDQKDRDSETAPKRPSLLRHVSTHDTLDFTPPRKDAGDAAKCTPTKRPDPVSSEESTPRTVVQGIAGFNIASPDKLEVMGLPTQELENPFGSSRSRVTPTPTPTPAPLFTPTSTGFTSTGFTFDPVKNLSGVGKAATPSAPTAGLNKNKAETWKDNSSKTSTETVKHPMKPPATLRKSTTPTAEPLTPSKPPKPTTTTATNTAATTTTGTTTPTTTPDPQTPTKPVSRLHGIPQIAPQYIPTYAHPDSPLKLNDPRTFSLSPPYWTRWPKTRYTRLATVLQKTIDLSAFALEENISVEEVANVFNQVVMAPLRDETEMMAAGAERRMEVLFKTIAEGKVWRIWEAGDGVRIKAEFTGARPGVATLVGEKGQAVEIRFVEMCERDQKYVKGIVSEGEWKVLMRKGE
jgi:hypothetical protein